MKRVFGWFEVAFDALYLVIVSVIATCFILTNPLTPIKLWAGIMAFVLVGGDLFHLLPRINVILTGQEKLMRKKLGRGKQITSITMTIFYLFLWQLGLLIYQISINSFWTYAVYLLALIRISICFLPQNKWYDRHPPLKWAILRNIPFFLLGLLVAGLFFLHSNLVPAISLMWLAILLSFTFYLQSFYGLIVILRLECLCFLKPAPMFGSS